MLVEIRGTPAACKASPKHGLKDAAQPIGRKEVQYRPLSKGVFVWCEESDRLLHEYNSAVLEVSRAVGKFADLAGTKSDADYYRLLGREKD